MKKYIILESEVAEVMDADIFDNVPALEAELSARGLKLAEPIPEEGGGVAIVRESSEAMAITPVKMRNGVVVG